MRVLTVYAHPSPKSFCHAILQQFTIGLEDAGHVCVQRVNCPCGGSYIKGSDVHEVGEVDVGGSGHDHVK